jgi:hypothetical protein
VISHEAVREALAAHPTAGSDQQAMVHDLCQGGQGVAVVVGRAGTGKTFALGIARHAWQLDGYRFLAAAPTGIAAMSLQGEGFEDVAMSLQGEGFEDVATCDRLLLDLDKDQEQCDHSAGLSAVPGGLPAAPTFKTSPSCPTYGSAHPAPSKGVQRCASTPSSPLSFGRICRSGRSSM